MVDTTTFRTFTILESELESVTAIFSKSRNGRITESANKYFDRGGIRAVLETDLGNRQTPAKINISFLGTMGVKSGLLDLDPISPGVTQMARVEADLLKLLNDTIQEIKSKYPDKKVNLNLRGFSLGGTLAQSFTEAVMRGIACANANKESLNNITDLNPKMGKKLATRLKTIKTNNVSALGSINAITLYGKSSPKTSAEIDDCAALLSHLPTMPNITAFYQQHIDIDGVLDPIVEFGESKLFSNTGCRLNRDKVKTHNLVVDCTIGEQDPSIRKGIRSDWTSGLLGDRHTGKLDFFKGTIGANWTVNSNSDLKIPRTKRSNLKRAGFVALNVLATIFVKPIRKALVSGKRAVRSSNNPVAVDTGYEKVNIHEAPEPESKAKVNSSSRTKAEQEVQHKTLFFTPQEHYSLEKALQGENPVEGSEAKVKSLQESQENSSTTFRPK